MFQGPKGYRAQTCEVHLQYGNSTTKWPFYAFLQLTPVLKECACLKRNPSAKHFDWLSHQRHFHSLYSCSLLESLQEILRKCIDIISVS